MLFCLSAVPTEGSGIVPVHSTPLFLMGKHNGPAEKNFWACDSLKSIAF
jgi:hypothetical protein